MTNLTIITACSRPENLARIAPTVAVGMSYFSLSWLVIFEDWHDEFSRIGNWQKNAALEAVRDGYVWFLDDDNLVYPAFFPALAQVCAGEAQAVFFHQQMETGVRFARPENVALNRIDLAQFVLDRKLIADHRFKVDEYNSDGRIIDEIWQKYPSKDKALFIDEVLCYYNRLNWAAAP